MLAKIKVSKEEIQSICMCELGFKPTKKSIRSAYRHSEVDGRAFVEFQIITNEYRYFYTLKTNFWRLRNLPILPDNCEIDIQKRKL